MFKSDAPTIGLDFDGVLHNYKGWDGPVPTQPPVEGALEMVKWLEARGFDLFIFSSRVNHPEGAEAIKNWLKNNGFPDIEAINVKRAADLYVDDRGFRFTGPGCWDELKSLLTVSPKPERWGSENGEF